MAPFSSSSLVGLLSADFYLIIIICYFPMFGILGLVVAAVTASVADSTEKVRLLQHNNIILYPITR